MKKIILLLMAIILVAPCYAQKKTQKEPQLKTDREEWVDMIYKISYPVLSNLSQGTLRQNMPIEQMGEKHPEYGSYGDRTKYAYLEAVGRTICGIAPWLELPTDTTPEGIKRAELLTMAIKGLENAMDTTNADYLDFTVGYQALVDAAHLAQGLMRAPKNLWGGLNEQTQQAIIKEMKATRHVRPNQSNWLMFSAMVEAFLCSVGEEYDLMRVDYPVRQMNKWYKGDGVYGDGEPFHWDYYNSFVIQPMFVDIMRVMNPQYGMIDLITKRSTRYAEVLERMISPEGTFPAMGRSLQYRMAAMQTLSQMALLDKLPSSVTRGQVRSALTTVYRRMLSQPGTFDADGWLTIGFCGHQKEIGEAYTCTGSLYLCTSGFVALGLPADSPFWTDSAADWTSKKAWNGEIFPQDHSLQ